MTNRVLIPAMVCFAVALSAGACSSTRQNAGETASMARVETTDALEDAVGLPRERPGPIMVDEGNGAGPGIAGGQGVEAVPGGGQD